MSRDKITIGSTVWVFRENRRVYRAPEPGRIFPTGGPIWREHWVPLTVTEETTRSWILSDRTKVPKRGDVGPCIVFSEAEINERVWIHDNAIPISNMVRAVTDYTTLRVIADVVGYKEKP